MKDTSDVGFEFLKTEVETGLVFARIAAEADEPEKRERNRANAQMAIEALEKFVAKTPLTQEQADVIASGIEELRRAIAAIPT